MEVVSLTPVVESLVWIKVLLPKPSFQGTPRRSSQVFWLPINNFPMMLGYFRVS